MQQPTIQDASAGEEELNRLLEEVSQLQWTTRSEAPGPADADATSESAKKKKRVRFAEATEDKELQETEAKGPEPKDEVGYLTIGYAGD